MIDIDNIKKNQVLKIESLLSSLRQEYENAFDEVQEKYYPTLSKVLEKSHHDKQEAVRRQKELDNLKELGIKSAQDGIVTFDKGSVSLTPYQFEMFMFLVYNHGNFTNSDRVFHYLYRNKPSAHLEKTSQTSKEKFNIIKSQRCLINQKIIPYGYYITPLSSSHLGYSIYKIDESLLTDRKFIPAGTISAKLVTLEGVTKTVREWLVEKKISYNCFYSRIKTAKWSFEKALTVEPRRNRMGLEKKND